MSRQEMLAHIGRLAQQRRNQIGAGRVPFAKDAGIGSDATVKAFEFGEREPNGASQSKLERALGWRHGVIHDLLAAAERDNMKPSDVDMEYLDGWEPEQPASRASDLDDVELLTEMIRRMERWKAALGAVASQTPAQASQAAFGLAANKHGKSSKLDPRKMDFTGID